MRDLVEKTVNESIMDEVKYIICFDSETSKTFCKELEALGKRVVSLNELKRHYKYVDYYVEFFNKIVQVAIEILDCISE